MSHVNSNCNWYNFNYNLSSIYYEQILFRLFPGRREKWFANLTNQIYQLS